jgi:hypothetical protein
VRGYQGQPRADANFSVIFAPFVTLKATPKISGAFNSHNINALLLLTT